MITRRTLLARSLLLGAGATLLGGALGGCARVPDDVPDKDTGPMVSGAFASRYRHARVGWAVSYPPGSTPGARLPVLVVLHGRGGDHDDAFGGSLHLDRFVADGVAHGLPRFAVAAADGGDHEYWHRRRGTDPAGMLVHEFLPLLARRGLDVGRIALLGWSMGGYGVLHLAELLGGSQVAAVVAESPAVWHAAGQTVAGAFDDPADFAANTVFGRLHRLRGTAMRLDCGDDDGFASITCDLRARLHPTPAGGIEHGGHEVHYWRSQAAAQLRFVGEHLAAGGRPAG